VFISGEYFTVFHCFARNLLAMSRTIVFNKRLKAIRKSIDGFLTTQAQLDRTAILQELKNRAKLVKIVCAPR
jgi:hypothetical protein